MGPDRRKRLQGGLLQGEGLELGDQAGELASRVEREAFPHLGGRRWLH